MASARDDTDFNKDYTELKQAMSVYEKYIEREEVDAEKAEKLRQTANRRLINLQDKAKEKGYLDWLQKNHQQLCEWEALLAKTTSQSSQSEPKPVISNAVKEMDAFIQELIAKPVTDDLSIRLANMIYKHGLNFSIRLYKHLLNQQPGNEQLAEKLASIDKYIFSDVKSQRQVTLEAALKDIFAGLPNQRVLEQLADLVVVHGLEVSISLYKQVLGRNNSPLLMETLGDIYFATNKFAEALKIYEEATNLASSAQLHEKKARVIAECEDLQRSACRVGDITKVQEFIALGVRSRLLIIDAVISAKIEVLRFVIDAQFPVDALDGNGWNAAHWAAYYNNLEFTELFYNAYIDLFDAKTGRGIYNGDESVLSVSVRYKAANVANFLIEKNCHLDTTDQNGWTPLCWAYKNDEFIIYKALVDKHVNPDVCYDKGNEFLIHNACRKNRSAYVEALLLLSVDTMVKTSKGETPLAIARYNASDGWVFKGSPDAKRIVTMLETYNEVRKAQSSLKSLSFKPSQ